MQGSSAAFVRAFLHNDLGIMGPTRYQLRYRSRCTFGIRTPQRRGIRDGIRDPPKAGDKGQELTNTG
eukprot:1208002-Amphidinium_carterae.1